MQIVLAVAVGALIRQSAGAIAVLLLWPLLIENLVGIIPKVGEKIQPFLPFKNADHFLGAPRMTPRRRLDETGAARKPVLRWVPEVEQREAAE